jgi:hypothetical protein
MKYESGSWKPTVVGSAAMRAASPTWTSRGRSEGRANQNDGRRQHADRHACDESLDDPAARCSSGSPHVSPRPFRQKLASTKIDDTNELS